jgi:kelch-like protein 20
MDLFDCSSILEEIKLFDIDEDVLSSIIDFCYTSRIVVDETNVMSLLLTARYLQMNEIQVGIHQLTNG